MTATADDEMAARAPNSMRPVFEEGRETAGSLPSSKGPGMCMGDMCTRATRRAQTTGTREQGSERGLLNSAQTLACLGKGHHSAGVGCGVGLVHHARHMHTHTRTCASHLPSFCHLGQAMWYPCVTDECLMLARDCRIECLSPDSRECVPRDSREELVLFLWVGSIDFLRGKFGFCTVLES